MEIRAILGYLFIDNNMIKLDTIRNIKPGDNNNTIIQYLNGDTDIFEAYYENVQNEIIKNKRYGEGYR